MADLIRTATIEQGYDPATSCSTPTAAPGRSHAFSYGAELGIDDVVVPLTASVHSAFGIAASDLTVAEEMSDPILSPPGTEDYAAAHRPGRVKARFDRLTERARAAAQAGADSMRHVARSVEMRFRFQIHVLTVPVPEDRSTRRVNALVRRFIDTYEARFGEGSAFSAAGIEMTTFRVVAGRPDAAAAAQSARSCQRVPRRTERPAGVPGGEWQSRASSATTSARASSSTVWRSSRCRTPPS